MAPYGTLWHPMGTPGYTLAPSTTRTSCAGSTSAAGTAGSGLWGSLSEASDPYAARSRLKPGSSTLLYYLMLIVRFGRDEPVNGRHGR